MPFVLCHKPVFLRLVCRGFPSCRRGSSNRAFLGAALAAAFALAAPAATNRLAIGFAAYSLSSNRLEVADIADPAAPLPVCHFDLARISPAALSAADGILRVEGDDGVAEFDLSDIFAPVLDSSEPADAVISGGLMLVACQTDGIRICQMAREGPPAPATHCLTDGPALAIATFPGGFAVALGTRGYALYDLDEFGLVTLRRQWPLETGAATAVTYDPITDQLLFDCEEGGLRSVLAHPVTHPDSQTPSCEPAPRPDSQAPSCEPASRPVGAVLQTAPSAP